MSDIKDKLLQNMNQEFSIKNSFSDSEGQQVYNGIKTSLSELEKLKGGKSDNLRIEKISKKHNIPVAKLKLELEKGKKIEREHTKNLKVALEIAKDHLYEDPNYYKKLKKMETNETWSEKYKRSIDCANPKGFSQKAHCQGKKKENKEATGAFSAGGYTSALRMEKKKLDEVMRVDEYEKGEEVLKMIKSQDKDLHRQLLFKIMDAYATSFEDIYDIVKRSDKISDETKLEIKRMSDEIKDKVDSQKKKKKGKKTETKEATGSGSSGSYVTPAAWAKSQTKKDWRGYSKTLIPGGKFVKVKSKCKKYPYCNQGDIKALRIFENERVKNAINTISERNDIPVSVIKKIIKSEIENQKNKSIK
jgi:hypothetical protein